MSIEMRIHRMARTDTDKGTSRDARFGTGMRSRSSAAPRRWALALSPSLRFVAPSPHPFHASPLLSCSPACPSLPHRSDPVRPDDALRPLVECDPS